MTERTSANQLFDTKWMLEPSTGCWVWGAATNGGYGVFWFEGVTVRAHRYAFERWVGPILDGLQLDHLCRVRCCVNPDHLEPVTSRENSLRGGGFAAVNAAKTHCVHGHEFTPENIYVPKSGGRECRACRATSRARYNNRGRCWRGVTSR